MKSRIPVSELPTIADVDLHGPASEQPLMTWNFELPPSLDAERITIDERHLRLVQKIGALSTTHVFSEQGDVSAFDYQINGINFDGTATMSGREVRTQTAEKERNAVGSMRSRVGRDLLKNYGKTATNHILNKSEIARLVSDERQETHQPSERLWADQLDDTLQASIRSAARKHLLGRATKLDRTGEAIQWAAILGLALPHFQNSVAEGAGLLLEYIALNRGTMLGLHSIANKFNIGTPLINELRFSLFSDMQPDRYIALDALTRASRLVHYKK